MSFAFCELSEPRWRTELLCGPVVSCFVLINVASETAGTPATLRSGEGYRETELVSSLFKLNDIPPTREGK